MSGTGIKFSRIITLTLLLSGAVYTLAGAQLELVGQLDLGFGNQIWKFTIDGSYAYAASAWDPPFYMYVIDTRDPQNPGLLASLRLQNYCNDLYTAGSYVYLAQQYHGMGIADVSNPASPQLVGVFDSARICHDVVVAGDRAYTASGFRVCEINIENPLNPQRTWFNNQPADMIFIRKSSSKIFVVTRLDIDFTYAMSMYDIASEPDPILLHVFDESYDIFNVAARGDTVFMVCSDSTLRVVDVSNGSAPSMIGSCRIWSGAWEIDLMGDVALITMPPYVQIIDISNPAMPFRVALNNDPIIEELVVRGDYIYAIGGYLRYFYILRLPSTATGNGDAERPVRIVLHYNYPDPFNAATSISYELPMASNVRVGIFDIRGRKLETLFDGRREAGEHRLRWDAARRGSGIYFCKVTAGRTEQTEKMLLIK